MKSNPRLCAIVLILVLWPLWIACLAATDEESCQTEAAAILKAADIEGGLVVHVGCGGGELTAALRADSRYLVQGLETSEERIDAARRHIHSKNLYGPISVTRWDGKNLPYASNLVNLIVCQSPASVPMDEVMRVLCPDGVACFKQAGRWVRKIKKRPETIDDWTHFLHGSDNNGVARDTGVGPPRRLQWKSDPLWCRSHDGISSSVDLVLSAGGRLFSVIDEGLTGQPGLPQYWTIVARDAFNGKLLWKKLLGGRRPPQKSLVATAEKLYLAPRGRDPVHVLDTATGDVLDTLENTEGADEIVCAGDRVVAHCAGSRGGKHNTQGSVVALSAKDGRKLWTKESRQFVRESLALANSRVYYHDGGQVICLNADDGDRLWQAACATNQGSGLLMVYGGAVFVTAPGGVRAFAAKTGEALWKGPNIHRRLGLFGANGLVWFTDIQERGRTFLWTPAPVVTEGRDPMTGKVRQKVSSPCLITPGHHIRCYPAKATERYLLLPKRGVEYVDLQGDDHMRHDWLRASCGHGVVPANGLLYAPPHQCFCYAGVKLTGFNALSAADAEPVPKKAERRMLERGVAYDWARAEHDAGAVAADWPMYRHDARRSGRAGCDVPVKIQPVWTRDFNGKITPPVLAGRHILVAQKEAHTISCLDAGTGEPVWSYTAGGRIDSPPTLHHGLVLFGSTDGWVYCLRQEDGRLAWRFRAAPEERQVVVHDQLESTWPVHGSVLVQNDVVYCTAGRSSFLDGGIWVYGLNPATGKVLHERRFDSPRPDVQHEAGRPFDMEGARSDLLVGDGADIYMYFVRLAPDLTRKETPRLTKLGDRRVSRHLMSNAGFLDTSWFDRNYWTYGSRWPGYYFGYNAPKVGQILVFDDEMTYGLHVFTTRQGHSPRFWPGKDGYELFADVNTNEMVLRPTAIGREKGDGFSRMLPPTWSTQVPVRARAMVLAGQKLFLAGPPDLVPEDDPMAAFEGRLGGNLWVVSTQDGGKMAEYELESPPVFDGLIAAKNRLYVSGLDGRLICWGAKP